MVLLQQLVVILLIFSHLFIVQLFQLIRVELVLLLHHHFINHFLNFDHQLDPLEHLLPPHPFVNNHHCSLRLQLLLSSLDRSKAELLVESPVGCYHFLVHFLLHLSND